MTKRIVVQESFKLALSMMLFFWLALWMNWDMPGVGGLAIILISLDTTGASLQKGLMRVAGTMLGLVVALVGLSLFPQDRWLTMVFFSLYLLVVGYAEQWSRHGYAWFVAGYLAPLVWATTYMEDALGYEAFNYAVFRFLETASGVIIYTLVCTFLWPIKAGDQLNRQGEALWPLFRRVLQVTRRQLTDEKPAPEGAASQMELTAKLGQMLATLQVAYVDSSLVRDQKPVWETLRLNAKILADALGHWRQTIDDCRPLDPEYLLPWFDNGFDILDKRLERLDTLWKAVLNTGHLRNSSPSLAEDTDLLRPLDMGTELSATAHLSRFDRAALMNFVQQLRLMDLSTRELLSAMRVLAGVDSTREFRPYPLRPDLYRTSGWSPQRLINAFRPVLCFVIAYFFWIYADPPGGPQLPAIAATFSLYFLLVPMKPMTVLMVILVCIWAFVAPVYFLVMPALDNGFELLTLIFVFTFVFGFIGGRSPALKLFTIVFFVDMTGISNDQVYAFMAFAIPAVMFVLAFFIIAVVDMLWPSSRPEQVVLSNIRRFFKGCGRIVGAFALSGIKGSEKCRKARKWYFESMLLPAQRSLQAAQKALNYKRLPDNSSEKMKGLLSTLQQLIFRLQSLELAFDRVSDIYPDLPEEINPLKKDLRQSVARIFKSLVRFQQADTLPDQRAALQKIAEYLEAQLDAHEKDVASPLSDNHVSEALYALLGSVRGLLQTMVTTSEAVSQINWDRWAVSRF